MILIFSNLNSLEMPISRYGLYKVGWNGPAPVTQVLQTPARQQLFERCLAKIAAGGHSFHKVLPLSNSEFGFVAGLFMNSWVERGNVLLDTYKQHVPCIFSLSRYNKIILSIHSTLLEAAGVLRCCPRKVCGIGLIFNCTNITTI